MNRSKLFAKLVPGALALLFALAGAVHAEEKTLKEGAKEAGHAVGTAVREVGHETKKVTKKAGKAVKKAATETGHAFRDGAKEFKSAGKGESSGSGQKTTKKD